MPPVFGRNDRDPHPYDEALEDLLAEDAERRAIACNLRFDERVSPAREEAFHAFAETRSGSGAALRKALTLYFKERVRFEKDRPDYVLPALNEQNLLTGGPTGRFAIHPDLHLGRILDLNGLTVPFLWAQKQTGEEWDVFRDFPQAGGQDLEGWLEGKLTAPGPAIFIPRVLAMLRAHRRDHPFEPAWAALWDDLDEILKTEPPHRWLEMIGAWKPAGTWLIVLRYRVRYANQLVRPTILDAGDSPYHFPSPLSSEDGQSRYGHPMDLCLRTPPTGLIKEYVHRQIDHPEEHWTAAGSLCVKTDAPADLDLPRQREAHLGRLRVSYKEVVDWYA